MAYRQDWIRFIRQNAPRYGVDPQTALAVAASEGLSGDVGDQGHAFGPFQLNDAGGVITNRPGNHRAFAESPAGIIYALQQIANVARGLRGPAGVNAIVRQFERPAAPDAEVARALSYYPQFSQTGGGQGTPSPVARPQGAPPSAPRVAAPAASPNVPPPRAAAAAPAPPVDARQLLAHALLQAASTGDYARFWQTVGRSRTQPVVAPGNLPAGPNVQPVRPASAQTAPVLSTTQNPSAPNLSQPSPPTATGGYGGDLGHGVTEQPGVDTRHVATTLLQRITALARATGTPLTITSGYRSVAHQQQLWDRYVASGYNRAYIAARPGASGHNYGLAVDVVTANGVPLGSAFNNSVLAKYGLVAPVSGDPVHTELADLSPQRLGAAAADATYRKRR